MNYSDIIRSEVDGVTRRLIFEITKSEDTSEYTYQVASSKTSAKLKVEGQCITIIIHVFSIFREYK